MDDHVAKFRLQMLWLAVTKCGGKLRVDKSLMEDYPGDDRAMVLSHTDPTSGDFILESKTITRE